MSRALKVGAVLYDPKVSVIWEIIRDFFDAQRAPIEMIEGLADRSIGRRMLEQAAIVLCVSKHTQAYVGSIAPRAATRVVGNGVELTVQLEPVQ